jgi:hypothetical protein
MERRLEGISGVCKSPLSWRLQRQRLSRAESLQKRAFKCPGVAGGGEGLGEFVSLNSASEAQVGLGTAHTGVHDAGSADM